MKRTGRRLKVLVVSSIDQTALETLSAEHDVIHELDPSPDSLSKLVGDREIIIFRSGVEFSERTLESAEDLRLMIRAGAGLDNVDLDYLAKRDIELRNLPEPGSQAVAELTLGLIIALSRNIVAADRLLRQNNWAKRELMGALVQGKTLGVVGVGRIGLLVGSLASSIGMECVGCVEPALMDDPGVERSAAEHGIRMVAFEEVVETADFLTVHVPLTPDTRHLIDAAVLRRMKSGAYLINTSRGGVVAEEDLCNALEDGSLRGAAVDVYEGESPNGDIDQSVSRLSRFPNVILTPHIGSMATEVQARIGQRILELVGEAAREWEVN